MTKLQPHEGQWYSLRTNGQMFYVINVDEEHEVIDIQDFDGDIDELDFEEWSALDLEPTAAPEDGDGLDASADRELDGIDEPAGDDDSTNGLRVRRISGDAWPDDDADRE